MSLRALVRALAALTAVVIALIAPGSAAVAQETCYPPPCAPGISDVTTASGQAVTVTSGTSSFEPGEPVEYGVMSVYQRLGETTADASGAVVVTLRIPELPAGRHSVVFTSLTDGGRVRVPFTVLTAAAVRDRAAVSPADGWRAAGWLPHTGSSELVFLAGAGAGLVATGAGLVLTARRRRGRLA